ncbi:MAG: phosphotransferase family protein [bacterium]|nr:phosphotransferase family protein [bacterium]MCM1374652.1 phosphotransferase family protein [Muribaculum sp.]
MGIHEDQLRAYAINSVCEALHVPAERVSEMMVLKKGMTNHSFLFVCDGKKYIVRIPGEGTDRLIDRRQEADVYRVIAGKGISDNIVYMNGDNGCKIAEYWDGARVCDARRPDDVWRCMRRLRELHEMKLTVEFEFDLFGQIDFYESLWDGASSVYEDYSVTKENVRSLKPFIDAHAGQKALAHIDAVADNFLIMESGEDVDVRLIDWEYAAMYDPHIDVAMFAVYSMYDRPQIDRLIAAYFSEGCGDDIRVKIYCYIAACGLLWSNWCEYKRQCGVEFGGYALSQYQYAKDYYRVVREEQGGRGEAAGGEVDA